MKILPAADKELLRETAAGVLRLAPEIQADVVTDLAQAPARPS